MLGRELEEHLQRSGSVEGLEANTPEAGEEAAVTRLDPLEHVFADLADHTDAGVFEPGPHRACDVDVAAWSIGEEIGKVVEVQDRIEQVRGLHHAPHTLLPLAEAAHPGDQPRARRGVHEARTIHLVLAFEPGAKEPGLADSFLADEEHARPILATEHAPQHLELVVAERERARGHPSPSCETRVIGLGDRLEHADGVLARFVLGDALPNVGAGGDREAAAALEAHLETSQLLVPRRKEVEPLERRELARRDDPLHLGGDGLVEIFGGRREERVPEGDDHHPAVALPLRVRDGGNDEAADADRRVDVPASREIGARNGHVEGVQRRPLRKGEAERGLRLRLGEVLRQEHLRLEQGVLFFAEAGKRWLGGKGDD